MEMKLIKALFALFIIYTWALGFIKIFIADDMYRYRLAMWATNAIVSIMVFVVVSLEIAIFLF